jgi:repressor LexA
MRAIDEDLLNRVAQYIAECQIGRGASPGQREIAARFKINSKRAHYYVHRLADRGTIGLNGDGTIAVPRRLDPSGARNVPLIGAVKCGEPTMATEEFEGMFKLPTEFTGTGDFFMLTAEGDSMEGAGIIEGDYLVIREQPTADIGDIVVALKESERSGDAEATLKRYMLKNGKPVLHPENERYEDIDAEEYRIVGRLAGFYRKM